MLYVKSNIVVAYDHLLNDEDEKKVKRYAEEHFMSLTQALWMMQDKGLIDIYPHTTKIEVGTPDIYYANHSNDT